MIIKRAEFPHRSGRCLSYLSFSTASRFWRNRNFSFFFAMPYCIRPYRRLAFFGITAIALSLSSRLRLLFSTVSVEHARRLLNFLFTELIGFFVVRWIRSQRLHCHYLRRIWVTMPLLFILIKLCVADATFFCFKPSVKKLLLGVRLQNLLRGLPLNAWLLLCPVLPNQLTQFLAVRWHVTFLVIVHKWRQVWR